VAAIGCGATSTPTLLLYDHEDLFVPGVTDVVLTGIVEESDPTRATFQLNGITVDYTGLLADAPEAPIIRTGTHVIVRGVTY